MKKILSLFVFLLVCVVVAPAVYAYPTIQFGENEMYYTNREVVFRDDGQGNYFELDYTDIDNPPTLIKGDIFVGILKVHEIVGDTGTWMQGYTDTLTGIFTQEITDIGPSGIPGDLTLKIDLGVASTSTFTTLANETFNTGLTGNEVMKFYAHDNIAWEDDGSIAQDFLAQTAGTDWMTLELDPNANDYAFTYIKPQGTGLDDFLGRSFLGFSISSFTDPGTMFPGVTDPEVGLLVDFYANSELEGHDDFMKTTPDSPWAFESNDPAFFNAVPEPGTFVLFGTALLGFSAMLRRKKIV